MLLLLIMLLTSDLHVVNKPYFANCCGEIGYVCMVNKPKFGYVCFFIRNL